VSVRWVSGRHVRVGIGYDAHQFAAGRPLMLGGVEIPYPLGLLGYSDADVCLHALSDAILGAAALGDLGAHFPTGDPRFEGASGTDLLGQVVSLVAREGYRVGNCDVTVVAQRPRLAAHVPAMRERIACILGVELSQVSVKATTTDHLGFTGRLEGIAAMAIVSLES
jgi:2-C-methyl-D-erythritol 2,4-cyclodiphosphate synthase